ncbi:MAG: CerR family C-terminal domain-containing protein [Deltaproteobacteria bacterium]|jgi:TetR/AcrR family transcriptional regulator, regulator of cefoperazone and chloramphenicol sensitivity
MKNRKKSDLDTQARLLQSACEVFAEKGYRDATIADICERAGANIAAANYYFRDKANLYAEAWRKAFQRSLEIYPADGRVPPGASPEERLRGRIQSILHRIADPQSYEFDIMYKELVNQTGLLVDVMQESIEPIRRGLFVLMRELLGEKASDLQVQLCQMSIRAQCFDLIIREQRRKKSPEGKKLSRPPFLDMDADVAVLADHILRFSLAGIQEIRRQIENGTIPIPQRSKNISQRMAAPLDQDILWPPKSPISDDENNHFQVWG